MKINFKILIANNNTSANSSRAIPHVRDKERNVLTCNKYVKNTIPQY